MPDSHSTLEVAHLLGLSVRSVQLMVDRGELTAWKTPGGHRRILRDSVARWLEQRGLRLPAPGPSAVQPARAARAAAAPAPAPRGRQAAKAAAGPHPQPRPPAGPAPGRAPPTGDDRAAAPAARILLIEDSKHFQNLISLLVRQHFPQAELHVADDGFAGLAMAGRLHPDVLLVDLLLPGIDGATLISSLRQHPQFAGMRLVVVTSLDASQREPYAFALGGLPVVHKPQVVAQLPALLREVLAQGAAHV